MHTTTEPTVNSELRLSSQLQQAVQRLTQERYRVHFHELAISADRLFQVLMVIQFLGAVLLAVTLTPRTWIGQTSDIHAHVWGSVLIGAVLASIVWYVAAVQPGRPSNKYVIATAQTFMSVLLIHITGGRIETHFHIFGSLAFLSLYRSYGVLLWMTGLVIIDHGARSYLWPQSVFGLSYVESWRWLEHAGWLAFEDAVLCVAMLNKHKEMFAGAQRWALLAINKQVVEEEVQRQTNELENRQHQLQHSTSRLQAVIDSAYDAYLCLDQKLRVVDWSRRAAELTGWQAQEVVGQQCADMMHLSELLVTLEYALRGDAGCNLNANELAYAHNQLVETVCQTSSGNHIYVEASWRITRIASQVSVNVFLRDVTSRRQLASQQMHSHKMEAIGQLAAGIAHEINTPSQFVGDNLCFLEKAFRQIDDMLTWAQATYQDDNSQRESASEKLRAKLTSSSFRRIASEIPKAIEQSQEGMQRISTITRAMKEFSHPGTANMMTIDLHNAISTTLTVCRNEWKYVAQVTTDFDDEITSIECHPGELNQVIINLVVNAAHAIGEIADSLPEGKGKIVVRTRRQGQMVEIEVEDNGPGIPEVIRHRIYDPFFTTKPVGKGTGQGLAIVHAVLERHHGTIGLKSAPGQGSTFCLRIPISQQAFKSPEHVEVFTDDIDDDSNVQLAVNDQAISFR